MSIRHAFRHRKWCKTCGKLKQFPIPASRKHEGRHSGAACLDCIFERAKGA